MRRKTAKQTTRKRGDVAEPHFAALHASVGHLTRVVQVRLFQLYYERLRHLKLSPGALSVLTAIHANPGITHGALADALAVHGPNLTKLIDRLVHAGLVERRRRAHDGRTTAHHLTPVGRTKAEAAIQEGLAHDRFATSALAPAERRTLLKLLSKLDLGLHDATTQRTAR